MYHTALVCLAVVCAVALAGCTPHNPGADTVSLTREDADFLAVIALDTSGSFRQFMVQDGRGHQFTMRTADNYFRTSIGSNNRMVIVQISANDRALLWDGTPQQLRQEFPNADAFRVFLDKKSDPSGSRVHDGVTDALEYVLSDRGVQSGKTRAALFVCSDFADNAPDQQESEQRLAAKLKEFGKTRSIVGFYFLDQRKVPIWRRHLQASGVKSWVCESEIVARPALPIFE